MTLARVLDGLEVHHVGSLSGCMCACGVRLMVVHGYINGQPGPAVAKVVARHQRLARHVAWAALAYGAPNGLPRPVSMAPNGGHVRAEPWQEVAAVE